MSDIGHNGGPPIEEGPFGRTGWVKVARDVREHSIVGFGKAVKPADPEKGFCYSRAEAWLDLIMECRYAPGEVMNRGRKMEVKPGQLLGAVTWLANRWNWTPKTVRWFLDQLQDDGMITRENDVFVGTQTEIRASPDDSLNSSNNGNQQGKQKGDQKGKHNGNQSSILSVCNYDIYQLAVYLQRQAVRQAKGQAEGLTEGQANGKHTASERQANGNTLRKEEGKKEEGKNQTTNQTIHDSARARDDDGDGVFDPKLALATRLLAPVVGSETDPDHDRADRIVKEWAAAHSSEAVLEAVQDWIANKADRTEHRHFSEHTFGRYVRQAVANIATRHAGVQVPAAVVKPPAKALEPGEIGNGIVIREDGRLDLINGARAAWLERFDGNAERLELVLIAIKGELKLHGPISIEAQVERLLSKTVLDAKDKDKRYAAQADLNRTTRQTVSVAGQPAETQSQRIARIAAAHESSPRGNK